MAKAVTASFNGHTVAESSETVVVEGNHYFPADSADHGSLVPSDHTSVCHWKGTAHYFHVEAGGQRSENACWTYPTPKEAASNIAGRLAFWKDVEVST